MLKHVSTRWLSIGRCLERLLKNWDPLKVFLKPNKQHLGRRQSFLAYCDFLEVTDEPALLHLPSLHQRRLRWGAAKSPVRRPEDALSTSQPAQLAPPTRSRRACDAFSMRLDRDFSESWGRFLSESWASRERVFGWFARTPRRLATTH